MLKHATNARKSMSKSNGSVPQWLRDYVNRGFRLIFYEPRTKGPTEQGWHRVEYKPEDYHEGQNVGVITGHEISEGKFLADVDFDWEDGVRLAKKLLPPTEFGYGRETRK